MALPHTPLPWAANGNGIHRGSACVATTDTRPYEQRVADAAFIMRACNAHYQMIEALKAALADIEAGGHESIELINAAIAAAEAEAR